MPADHSIYLNMKAPDIAGGITRGLQTGMNMRQMADQRDMQQKKLADQDAMKKAYAMGVQTNPDGTTTFNQGIAMSEMAKINPEMASKMYQNQQANKFQQDKFLQEKTNRNQDVEFRKNKLDLERRRLRIDEKAAKEKSKNTGFSVGQKKVDQEFAKDYNEWTSGNSEIARSEINKLQSVSEKLKNGSVTTGGLTGMFPDQVTSNEVLSARSDVQSTVMNSLRAILGAQFTEKEGDRIIKNTWNEADSTENNLARINRLVSDLTAQAEAKDAKAQYFKETGGTLKDFSQKQSSNLVERQTKDGRIAIFDEKTKQFVRYK
jgi:hypothetical protein